MFCPKCGSQLMGSAVFCSVCGERLPDMSVVSSENSVTQQPQNQIAKLQPLVPINRDQDVMPSPQSAAAGDDTVTSLQLPLWSSSDAPAFVGNGRAAPEPEQDQDQRSKTVPFEEVSLPIAVDVELDRRASCTSRESKTRKEGLLRVALGSLALILAGSLIGFGISFVMHVRSSEDETTIHDDSTTGVDSAAQGMRLHDLSVSVPDGWAIDSTDENSIVVFLREDNRCRISLQSFDLTEDLAQQYGNGVADVVKELSIGRDEIRVSKDGVSAMLDNLKNDEDVSGLEVMLEPQMEYLGDDEATCAHATARGILAPSTEYSVFDCRVFINEGLCYMAFGMVSEDLDKARTIEFYQILNSIRFS